jgi:hypothetical protein
MSFLDDILLFTHEYEAPARFYYWAGLASVSAILKDNVFFNMGEAYKLYPNIYVLLYGPSGVRKGPPIAMAEKLVKKVASTRVINGRASIEAIIKELGTFKTRPDKTMDKDSSGFIVASELSSSIISNPSAMDILTNLYDRIYNEGEWEYKLKVGESHKLIRPTITWLAGSNEALFREFVPEKNINGGLIGRMFIINEQKENTINSLMYKPDRPLDDKAYKSLVDNLLPLRKLEGEFAMGDEVRKGVDLWYREFKKNRIVDDQTGFTSRLLDFVIKVAMLVSSGRRGDKVITFDDIEEAMNSVIPLYENIKKISHTVQKEDKSQITKNMMMMKYLTKHELVYRKKMLRDLGLQINSEDLDRLVNHLFAMDAIVQSRNGNDITYSCNSKHPAIIEFLKNFRG